MKRTDYLHESFSKRKFDFDITAVGIYDHHHSEFTSRLENILSGTNIYLASGEEPWMLIDLTTPDYSRAGTIFTSAGICYQYYQNICQLRYEDITGIRIVRINDFFELRAITGAGEYQFSLLNVCLISVKDVCDFCNAILDVCEKCSHRKFPDLRPDRLTVVAESPAEKKQLLANGGSEQKTALTTLESPFLCGYPIRKNVYITYHQNDRSLLNGLCHVLNRNGVRFWFAPDYVRTDVLSESNAAMMSADYMIVLASDNLLSSDDPIRELSLANTYDVPIIMLQIASIPSQQWNRGVKFQLVFAKHVYLGDRLDAGYASLFRLMYGGGSRT